MQHFNILASIRKLGNWVTPYLVGNAGQIFLHPSVYVVSINKVFLYYDFAIVKISTSINNDYYKLVYCIFIAEKII